VTSFPNKNLIKLPSQLLFRFPPVVADVANVILDVRVRLEVLLQLRHTSGGENASQLGTFAQFTGMRGHVLLQDRSGNVNQLDMSIRSDFYL
jgi:hypothetical protein